jgi:rhodanese-related sulfurtransferase
VNARRVLPRLALLLLLVAAAGWAALHRDQINLATLDAWLGSLGPWAPVGYGALYAVATVAFVPIIDVRGADEFTGPLGHIAAARNIPVAELDGRLAELAEIERGPIVLVCRTDKRSTAAAQTLRAAGFTQVSVLRRGMERWNEAGLPVEARAVGAAG